MAPGVSGDRHGKDDGIVRSVGYVIAACICFVAGLAFAVRTTGESASHTTIRIADRINPNDASPVSLARLPGVGPARARAIVFHRSRLIGQGGERPAFGRPEDLLEITGIGPATVEGVSTWLYFDSPPADELGITGRQPSEPLPK